MSRWLWIGACLLGACDAADAPTQTIISIDAQPAVRAATARLAVDIRGLSGGYHKALTPEPTWPLKFVLAPEHDDASRRFSIEVAALNQESERLVAFSIASGFRRGASAYAELVIDDRCVEDEAACISMECNSQAFDGDELGRSRADALVVHVSCTENDGMPMAGVGGDASGGSAEAGGDPVAGAGGSRSQTGYTSGGTGGIGGQAVQSAAGSGGGRAGCADGYQQMGSGCADVNECRTDPCGHGSCTNQPGSYTCSCEPGYHDDAGTCVADDPCATDNGGCSGTCTSASGRVQCACPTGSWLKSDAKSCGRVGPGVKLSPQGSLVRAQPQLAFDGQGRAWAVWIQAAEDGLGLWGTYAEPGQGFVPATKLPIAEIAPVRAPRLAVSPDGASGLVLWLQPNSDRTRLELWSSSVQNGMWDSAVRIDGEFGDVSEPVLALDKQGVAVAAWTESQGDRYQVWMSQWSPTKRAWGDAIRLAGTDTVDASWPRLSLDEKGGGALVWTQVQWVNGMRDAMTASLWGAHLDLASDAEPKTLLLAATSGLADVAIKPDGTGLLVWLGYVNQAVGVLANPYRPGMGLEPTTRRNLVMPHPVMDMQMPRFMLSPRVALNARGDGVAMWVEFSSSSSTTVWGTTYDAAGGAWAIARQLSPQQSVAPGWMDAVAESGLSLALDAQGNGVTVWSDFATGFTRDVWLQPVRATKGFLDRVHVVEADSVPRQPSRVEAAVDSDGRGFLIWDVQVNSRYEVHASRLE